MSLTHALSTNSYGPAKIIVATNPANGTHVTLASAMAYASAGDTIFLRDSVTENVTITPGVNIAAWQGEALNTVSITGTLTMTGAGTSTISGLTLITNSAFAIAVTGSAPSILNLNNCYLNCSNNTGISFTSSSGSSSITFLNSQANVGTTGITLFSHSGAGTLLINGGSWGNTGGSSTASTVSGTGFLGLFYQNNFQIPLSISSTAQTNIEYCRIATSATNTTCLTHTSTNATPLLILHSVFESGSASAVSIGAGATAIMDFCTIASSNTNAVTGAGTLQYGIIEFSSTSSLVNVTTQTQFNALPFNKVLTFTPGISFGGGTTGITYTTQTGRYKKISTTIYFQITIILSNKGSSTGAAAITGLPVATDANGTNKINQISFQQLTLTALYTGACMQNANSGTTANLFQQGSTQNLASLTDVNFGNTTLLTVNGFYFTD